MCKIQFTYELLANNIGNFNAINLIEITAEVFYYGNAELASFVDDEGTKRIKHMILYSAITDQFIPQKRRRSAAEETDVQLYRWSTDVNIDR